MKKALITFYTDGTVERSEPLSSGVLRSIGADLIELADNVVIPASNGSGAEAAERESDYPLTEELESGKH